MATPGTGEGALQLEIINAFSKKKKHRHQTAERSWLYSHCTRQATQLFHRYEGDTTNVLPFEKQTYFQWKSLMQFERVTHPRRQRRRIILIQPLTHLRASPGYTHTQINPSILDLLCKFCEAFFTEMTVRVNSPIDLSDIPHLTQRVHKDTNREQFLVGDILKYLQSQRPKEAYCTVGVTVADLYPSPEWNFVLGEASMNVGCGVFSFGRTFNSSVASDNCEGGDGCEDGDGCEGGDDVRSHVGSHSRDGDRIELEQFRNMWILMRVMTHELCHIFGLKHCYYFKCAMNDSKNIHEAATQPLFLCPVCIKKVQKIVKFNLSHRYERLLETTREIHQAVNERAVKEWASKTDKSDKDVCKDRAICEDTSSTVPHEQTIDSSCDAVSAAANCHQQPDVASNSHHLHRFEGAIEWLERTLAELREFEGVWIAPGKATNKNKIV